MNIIISPETQKLLEEQMAKCQFATPDEAVQLALRTLDQVRGVPYDELDEQTRMAIEEGEAQFARGEGRDWSEVRDGILKRFARE